MLSPQLDTLAKSLMFRALVRPCLAAIVALATALLSLPCHAQDDFLTIGSKAPALDIEHWLQDGNGFFKPVTDFEDDKIYVVEFWATWCNPCISSMPTLAEIQNKYRGRDVQIVSASIEPLETVQGFLKRSGPDDKTFGEITAPYCLTTDPDESTYRDYMTASGQSGIPMSFIVGKTGLIEWAGHPMLMEEPLEKIVEGTWDRAEFKLQYEDELRFGEIQTALRQLYQAGRIDVALQLIQEQIPLVHSEEIKTTLRDLAHETRFEYGLMTKETMDFYRERLKTARTDPDVMLQLVVSTISALEVGPKARDFADDVVQAYETAIEAGQTRSKAEAYQFIAMIHERKSNLKKSVEAMQKAVDVASGGAKRRLQTQLKNLQAMAEASDAEE